MVTFIIKFFYFRLFNTRLFSIGTIAVPRGINAYKELGIKHEPLRLITPQFETPLPPLQVSFQSRSDSRVSVVF